MEDVTTSAKLRTIDLLYEGNFKSVELIDIGFGARSSLKNLKEIDSQKFKLDCKNFLIVMFKKLMEKSPLHKKMVLGASSLNPEIMKSEALRTSRARIAIEALISHSQLSPAEGDVVIREYKKFCENSAVQKKLNEFDWKRERLDNLFVILFNEINQGVNRTLSLFIQRILVCFHGNAAVERSFSFNKAFLVENLHEKSLIAQRSLHDHIGSVGGIHSLIITKQMIQEFRNASGRRNEDLKLQKEADDQAHNARKRAAMEMRKLQLKKQKLLEEKHEELSTIDNKLKLLKKSL